MRQYWVVSANIGNKGRDSVSLRSWVEAVLTNHSAYMGWPASSVVGRRFSKIKRGDLILIAHGSMKNHGSDRRLVACGRVTANHNKRDPRLDRAGITNREHQHVICNPFYPLDEDPKRCGISLANTTHDGNPQPPAVFELTPADMTHPGNKALCDWLQRTIDGSRRLGSNSTKSERESVIANAVKVDPDANSEEYEVMKKQDILKAQRRERELVNQFAASLQKRNIMVDSLRYVSAKKIFFCDVYVNRRGHLIEAKGSASREHIRMAIGQLLDYKQLTEQAGGFRDLQYSSPNDLRLI
jgi:hypothetical protein